MYIFSENKHRVSQQRIQKVKKRRKNNRECLFTFKLNKSPDNFTNFTKKKILILICNGFEIFTESFLSKT